LEAQPERAARLEADRALTVRQPWAFLILRPDVPESGRARLRELGLVKDVENRTWGTRVRGRVWVHAGREWDGGETVARNRLARWMGVTVPSELPLGAIVGSVEIVDCVREMDSPWFGGPFGFVLADPRPLREPVPCAGKQGFWRPGDELAEKLADADAGA